MGSVINLNVYRTNQAVQHLQAESQDFICINKNTLRSSINRPLVRIQERLDHFVSKGFSCDALSRQLDELSPAINAFEQLLYSQATNSSFTAAQWKGVSELQARLDCLERLIAHTERAFSQIRRVEFERPILLQTVSSQNWDSSEIADWTGFTFVGGKEASKVHFDRLIRLAKDELSLGNLPVSAKYLQEAAEVVNLCA